MVAINIQWYPGHMTKTKRLIQENLKMVDMSVELVDARLPLSSRNPDIEKLMGQKPRIVAINKSDLADPSVNMQWEKWFDSQGQKAILIDSVSGKGLKQIPNLCKEVLKDKIERQKQKGIISRSIKLMIVGIPNVGKSSFVNKFAGKASTKTGDKPGVTRGKQWIRIKREFELLDTPGILWPKFEDVEVGKKLAYTGAIKDEIIDDLETLTCDLLTFLASNYAENLKNRYKLENVQDESGYALLQAIAKKRGCVVAGGELDTLRAANIILDEFRGCKIGKVSLERP